MPRGWPLHPLPIDGPIWTEAGLLQYAKDVQVRISLRTIHVATVNGDGNCMFECIKQQLEHGWDFWLYRVPLLRPWHLSMPPPLFDSCFNVLIVIQLFDRFG